MAWGKACSLGRKNGGGIEGRVWSLIAGKTERAAERPTESVSWGMWMSTAV